MSHATYGICYIRVMAKLSPNYRDDPVEGLPADIKEYLDEHFLKNLPNLQTEHPKLLVVYSGGNGVGKSSLSRRISQELGGLVLENDAMKAVILQIMPDLTRDELNPMTWQYSIDLYKRLDGVTPNGLVVRDGVIDWYYDRILPIFEEQGYPLFIVGFDLSKEKRIQLLESRGDKPTITVDRFIELLADHDIHTGRFRTAYTPDVVLHDENVFDHDLVIQKLKERIRQL